jgi:hypothetical protein
MRLFLGVISLLASFSVAFAGPKEDALQVIDMWAKAFTASEGSKTVVINPEGIRKYFEAALLTNRPRGATLNSYEAMPLSDTAVVITGLDTVTGVKDGNPISAAGRVTFVVAKQGTDWRIVHFHRSAMPQ